MEIQSVKISKIKPYKANNRIHTDEQLERIGNSIKEFGFNQPIVVDENYEVLVGHGRLEASRRIGLKEIPVCIIKDLTETKKRAYRILDNKLQNDSTWDFGAIEGELAFLEHAKFEMDAWGLDDLQALFGDAVENEEPETEWKGMPEFESKEEGAFRKIIIHFANEEDVNTFAKTINQELTNKTKSVWFPAIIRRDLKGMKIVSED